MTEYGMSEQARKQVEGFNPRQVVFFAMSSRRKNAFVVSAHISRDAAAREARKLGSCVRAGLVKDGRATML